MTTTAIIDALLGYLVAQWSATPVAWPNQPFTPPASVPWIRPTVLLGRTKEGEMGETGVGLRSGVLIVDVFQPLLAGIKVGTGHCDTVEALYRRADIGGVLCDEPYSENIGVDQSYTQDHTGGIGIGFYHLRTVVPFQAWIGE